MRIKDFKGNEFISVKEMCKFYGIGTTTYNRRRAAGMSLKETLTQKKYLRNKPVEESPLLFDDFEDEFEEDFNPVDNTVEFEIKFDKKHNRPFIRFSFDEEEQFKDIITSIVWAKHVLEINGKDASYLDILMDHMHEYNSYSRTLGRPIGSAFFPWVLRAFPYILQAIALNNNSDCPDFVCTNVREQEYIKNMLGKMF